MLSCSHAPKPGPSLSILGLALLGLSAPSPSAAQVAVPTQHNDNARTGANTAETALTPANVNVSGFGKLFTISLDANVNSQPLYVPNVTVGGASRNVLYVYTSNNTGDNSPCSLYAFDADTGAQLWRDSGATATVIPPSARFTTAAPTIDPATNTLYLVTKSNTINGLTYLRAYDIATGGEKPGSPVTVSASVPGTGDGGAGGVVSFDSTHANDRASLLLLNGIVYVSFANNHDTPPYHGWVIGYRYDGARFTRTGAFCTTPNKSTDPSNPDDDGGVWQAGKGLMADREGFIYFAVGNGPFDVSAGGANYGMCYVKLRTPDLAVSDYFAPYDEQTLSSKDLDLGGAGPVGIPGTTRLFAGASKFGAAFLMNSLDMGKFTPGGPDKAQRLNGVSLNNRVGQNPISWDAGTYKYVYLWPGGSGLEQFRYDPAAGAADAAGRTGQLNPAGVFKQNTLSTGGGALAVSSNASSNGILWAEDNGGVLRAFRAGDVSQAELWDSGQNAARDALGGAGHWQFPTVTNGKVYVPTGAATIAVYGLLSPPAPGTAPLYRLYSPYNGTHFYTVSAPEADAASQYGYRIEGIIGYAPADATVGYSPVYRTLSAGTGEHFYTTSADERAAAGRAGYGYESVGFATFTAPAPGRVPLFRLYYPGGSHFYTTDQAERDSLVRNGWSDEGTLGYLRTGP